MNFFSIVFAAVFSATVAVSPSPRIINGKNAVVGQFPYMVSVRTATGHVCGGGIISPTWIVSAAHCIVPNLALVLAGVVRFNAEQEFAQKIPIKRIIKANYVKGRRDICIIQLEKPLTFNQYVQPLRIPLQGQEFFGEVVATGWGRANATYYPDNLRFDNLQTKNTFLCSIMWSPYFTDFSEKICTTPNLAFKGPCYGDSGGPLVRKGVLIGVVAMVGIDCNNRNWPPYYTKVSYYANWIKQYVKDL